MLYCLKDSPCRTIRARALYTYLLCHFAVLFLPLLPPLLPADCSVLRDIRSLPRRRASDSVCCRVLIVL
uniref:Uncharacterized protein n=1 Tax=Anopheles quadriannulatus TaxID=34691 RepID=A0A182XSV6_ANOQN